MSDSLSLGGKAKLSEIIKQKGRDTKRFKEGFHLTVERNIEKRIITFQEGVELIIELETMKL